MTHLPWISILPAVVTILLALGTKNILPSLAVGWLVGGFIKGKGFLEGFQVSVEAFTKNLSQVNNIYVLLFLYLFSALIYLVRRAGGLKAFTKWLETYIKSPRGVLWALWGLIPFTFIDCGFRVVATGSILSEPARKHKILPERLALMLNNTAGPLVELIPIGTTFVAYNLGLIQDGLRASGQDDQSAYAILLKSIPLEFFSLALLIATFALIFFSKAKDQGHKQNLSAPQKHKAQEEDEPELKPRIVNLVLPLLLVVGLSLVLFTQMPPAQGMLVALLVAGVFSCILFLLQGYPLKTLSADVIQGGNQIISTLAILALAWPLAQLSRDLGVADLIQGLMGNHPSVVWMPVMAYFVTGALTYFIGSSWGAQALVMPVAIPLIVSGQGSVPLMVAAVLSGGSFGDVTSPISGMTNMAAHATGANHDDYIHRALIFNGCVFVFAAVLFVIAGWFLQGS